MPSKLKWRKRRVTLRQHRYRARRRLEGTAPAQCALCGSTRFLVGHHVDHDERNDNLANLLWLCKSCNTREGIAAARAGIGRRTRGNPARVVTREQTERMQAKAITLLENIDSDDPNDIEDMSVEEYAERKHLRLSNPGAQTLAEYVAAATSHRRGAHDAGGAVIHATPPDRRSRFSKEIWRRRRAHGTDRKPQAR